VVYRVDHNTCRPVEEGCSTVMFRKLHARMGHYSRAVLSHDDVVSFERTMCTIGLPAAVIFPHGGWACTPARRRNRDS